LSFVATVNNVFVRSTTVTCSVHPTIRPTAHSRVHTVFAV